MKKFIFISCILMCTNFSFAQEIGKFRGGLEVGFIPYEGFGLSAAMELKYNVQNNMNVGFKTTVASVIECKCYSAELLSFSFTYDYYFHYKNSLFSPFVGAGLGYYFRSANENHTETRFNYNNPTCFARVGLEVWKIRIAVDYNLVRKPKHLSNRNADYMSISLGFYIGGGKWKKKEEL